MSGATLSSNCLPSDRTHGKSEQEREREECGHCGFVPKLINVYNKTGKQTTELGRIRPPIRKAHPNRVSSTELPPTHGALMSELTGTHQADSSPQVASLVDIGWVRS